jgi:DNA helicase-2/ATP-dependent DNA helicase PcrA
MEVRLENEGITDVEISTFHAFAQSILKDNVLESGINISGGTLKRSSQLVWGLKNIDEFNFEYIKVGNNAEDVIRAIIDGIRTFKDELITPEELKKYLDSKLSQKLGDEEQELINRLVDLHKVYEKYQEFWSDKTVIDFNDMIVDLINLLKTQDSVRKRIQEKYKHILVDELQDNNYAQLEIVKLISSNGNVTAVGDDDQSIFRFQGAYMKNFFDFQEYFIGTKVVNLDQNYRSTKNIVNLANSLVQSIPERQKKNLFSENIEGQKIKVVECTTESSEAEFVVKTIKELLGTPITYEDGTEGILSYGDVAILSRSRSSGTKFVKSLKAHGLPADFMGAGNLFSLPIIKDVMAYLNIADSPITAGREITRLMKNHGISEYNISKINHYADKIADSDNPGVDFVLKSLEEFCKQDISQKKEIEDFISMIQKTMDLSHSHPSDIVYKIIMSISGLYKKTLSSDNVEEKINRILLNEVFNYALEYETIYPDGTLDDFISYLKYLFRFDPEMPEELEIEDSITVTTIHSSKGREFQVVFIVDVAKDKLPLRPKTKKFYVPQDLAKGLVRTDDEKILHLLDEKRLFYVAMTRAKSHLYITYAQDYESRKKTALPSDFLEELDFRENPLIELSEFKGNENIVLEEGERIEQLRHQYQQIANNSINQMNLGTAIQKIIDLAKIQYFKENNTLDGFDTEKLLKIEPEKSPIDSQLYQEKTPLITKEGFRLSPSKINDYDKCPLQFKFKHVLNIPTPQKTWLDMGTAIHSVAENLTRLEKEGVTPSEKLALEILEKNWDSSVYRNQRTQEREAKESSNKMIQTLLDWIKNNPNKAVDVEARFKIVINDAVISGQIDRVETTPNGDFEVVDFKTGRDEKTKNTIKDDIQMNMYALGTEKLYGKLPKKSSLFYIKHDKIVPYEIDQNRLEEFKTQIGQKIEDIFDEKFDAKPEYFKCKMCDYTEICDAKEISN